MSYSRGTPNYNLPQTQGSDKRDWADTNAAFLAVDTALKTANDNASSAGSAASTAQSTANSASTAASNAQSTANSAVSSAAAAAELATTAKNRADSAYTLADSKLAKSDVVNNVTTTTSGKALDARQGKALNDAIATKISEVKFSTSWAGATLPYTATKDCFFRVSFVTPSTGTFYQYLQVDGTTQYTLSGQAGGANFQNSMTGFLAAGETISLGANSNTSSQTFAVKALNVS